MIDFSRPKPAYYGACSSCTAKWFSPEPVRVCPRCGAEVEIVSGETEQPRAVPPWESAPQKATRTPEAP